MRTKIKKWNENLAIKIPQAITDRLQIREGLEAKFAVAEGNIVITFNPSNHDSLKRPENTR